MEIGIIGYGAMGKILAQAIADGKAGEVSLVAVMDVFNESPSGEEEAPAYFTQIKPFLEVEMDAVVETASQSALKEYASQVVISGKHLIAMSTGAFSDTTFLDELRNLTLKYNRMVILPSGAIGGLDALMAAGIEEIYEVTITSTKPTRALLGGLSALDRDFDLTELTEPILLYEGPAEDAVTKFPHNVNVAATLSLAGIGLGRTKVRLIADPRATQNTHRIDVQGVFGELHMEFILFPSPTNPKTSYLAALSAIRSVKNLTESFRVGY